jgi:hypothetical protein
MNQDIIHAEERCQRETVFRGRFFFLHTFNRSICLIYNRHLQAISSLCRHDKQSIAEAGGGFNLDRAGFSNRLVTGMCEDNAFLVKRRAESRARGRPRPQQRALRLLVLSAYFLGALPGLRVLRVGAA